MTNANKFESITYVLIFGSGADGYSWWKDLNGNAITRRGTPSDDFTGWSIDVTMETGEGDTITKTIDHQAIMDAVHIITNPDSRPKYVPESVVEDMRQLHNRKLDADIDANAADILIQVAVLGEVVFG